MELRKYKLGDIGEVRMCKRILKEETNTISGIPFYKIGTFGNKADVFISLEKFKEYKEKFFYPKKGDILISAAGTIGRTVIYDGSDSYFQDSNIVWIDNDETKVLNKYLFYCYKNIHWFTSKGSTILRLYNDNIRNTEIIVPPLESQQKIAAVLFALDDKIALNRRMNAKLEQMAKRLYDHWFVQFDFPNADGKPYKSSGGKMVYSDVLKREIPAGWEVVCFADFIEIGNGKDHSKLPTGNIPVYGSGGFMRGVTNFLYDGESVLFPRKGTLNNIMYKNEKFWTVDTMFYSKMKISHSAIYVYYTAKQFDFVSMNTGTGVPSMTSVIIKGLPIIKPTQDILDFYDDSIQPIYKKIHQNEKETQKLTALRDRLLPLLMNGQVEVR